MKPCVLPIKCWPSGKSTCLLPIEWRKTEEIRPSRTGYARRCVLQAVRKPASSYPCTAQLRFAWGASRSGASGSCTLLAFPSKSCGDCVSAICVPSFSFFWLSISRARNPGDCSQDCWKVVSRLSSVKALLYRVQLLHCGSAERCREE